MTNWPEMKGRAVRIAAPFPLLFSCWSKMEAGTDSFRMRSDDLSVEPSSTRMISFWNPGRFVECILPRILSIVLSSLKNGTMMDSVGLLLNNIRRFFVKSIFVIN